MQDTNQEFNFESLKKAGEITSKAREFGKQLIKPGVKISYVVEQVENKIYELGGKLAFPVNISLNETAAHDTARINDNRVFKDEVIKLDVGAHIDGWIGDSACTVDLSGENSKLVEASQKALSEAIKIIKKGVTLGDIGKKIEDTIKSYGFNPVRNLAGHQIGNYVIHTGTSIPNYDTKETQEIKAGTTFAIEPFATTGIGMIEERGQPEIFSIENFKPIRLQLARDIMKYIGTNYLTLPFSNKMLAKKFNENKIRIALKMLNNNGTLKQYRPLVERSDGLVSQAEHTLYVNEDWNVHILTK